MSLLITYFTGIIMMYIFLALLILIADTITKIWATGRLKEIGTIPIIEDIFHLTYVENDGIAFGMFGGGRIFFIIISVLVLAILAVYVYKTKYRTIWLKLGSVCVASGAIGNIIDRIFRGFVVDFLDFRIINFPVFNIADIAVCVGAAMLAIHFIKSEESVDE